MHHLTLRDRLQTYATCTVLLAIVGCVGSDEPDAVALAAPDAALADAPPTFDTCEPNDGIPPTSTFWDPVIGTGSGSGSGSGSGGWYAAKRTPCQLGCDGFFDSGSYFHKACYIFCRGEESAIESCRMLRQCRAPKGWVAALKKICSLVPDN